MNQDIRNKRIENIVQLVEMTDRNLTKIKDLLRNLDKDEQRDKYKDVEGLTGIYDGVYLVPEKGDKIEVPGNYAAKSRLVAGDSLKLITEDGKQVFKQIDKVDRKKVSGILTKKEGKWHIISDSGTYRVSDIAADFQQAQINDEAEAFVPSANLNVTYAALDKVVKKQVKIEAASVSPIAVHAPKHTAVPAAPVVNNKVSLPAVKTTVAAPKTSVAARPAAKRPTSKPTTAPKAPAQKVFLPPKKEFVEDIVKKAPVAAAAKPNEVKIPEPKKLDDDDLR